MQAGGRVRVAQGDVDLVRAVGHHDFPQLAGAKSDQPVVSRIGSKLSMPQPGIAVFLDRPSVLQAIELVAEHRAMIGNIPGNRRLIGRPEVE